MPRYCEGVFVSRQGLSGTGVFSPWPSCPFWISSLAQNSQYKQKERKNTYPLYSQCCCTQRPVRVHTLTGSDLPRKMVMLKLDFSFRKPRSGAEVGAPHLSHPAARLTGTVQQHSTFCHSAHPQRMIWDNSGPAHSFPSDPAMWLHSDSKLIYFSMSVPWKAEAQFQRCSAQSLGQYNPYFRHNSSSRQLHVLPAELIMVHSENGIARRAFSWACPHRAGNKRHLGAFSSPEQGFRCPL